MTVVAGPQPVGLDSLVGQMVASGRYRIVKKLGQGGMGTVFLAEQVSVRRKIALKLLDPALSFEPELMKRFEAEAEVAARLSHPNTVTLFDFGRDEQGRLYIAMEYAEGRPLREVVAAEAPLPAARAVYIIEQVASSLADAHDHGITHRDMKPDNVILSERGGQRDIARVLDFGIAKLQDSTGTLVQGREPMTRAGQILGTPQYMAPEQILGQRVDGRTDIYALGMMLYEMLTARLPFNAPTVMALLAMHMHDPPRPIHEVRPDVPPALAAVVMRCLEKSPDARPASMRALLAELAAIRAQLGVTTPMPGFVTPVGPYPGPPSGPYAGPPPIAYGTPAPGHGAPAYAAPTPAPLPYPPVQPPPRRGGGNKALIAAVVAVVAAGGGVGVFFATRGGSGGDTPASTTPSPGPAVSIAAPEPQAPDKTFRASRLGYTLDLPGSIEVSEDPTSGGAAGHGYVDGAEVAVVVVPAASGDPDTIVSAVMGTLGDVRLVEKRTRVIRGNDILSVIYEVPGQGRLESCVLPGAQTYVVTFAAKPDEFDKLAAFRDSLFRDRFQAH
jgi:serine/threonine-protein kinase